MKKTVIILTIVLAVAYILLLTSCTKEKTVNQENNIEAENIIPTYYTFEDRRFTTTEDSIMKTYFGTLRLKQYTQVICPTFDGNDIYWYYFTFEGTIKIATKLYKTPTGYQLSYILRYNLSGSTEFLYTCNDTFKGKVDVADPRNYSFNYKVRFTDNAGHEIIVNATYSVNETYITDPKILISNFLYDSGGCY